MSEQSTTTKMCRVVAERWGLLRPRQAESITTCDWGDCWSETVAERSSGVGWLSVCDVHALIDIPNDPVAASALRIALEKAGYSIVMRLVLNRWHIKLMRGEFRHDHLWPNVTASNEKLETALLEAAYQTTLAEGQP